MNAIDYLTRFETDCLNLYGTLESTTADPDLKKLYQLLADDRRTYLADLLTLKETMTDDDMPSVQIDRAGHLLNSCRQTLLAVDIGKEMRSDHDGYSHVIHAEEEMINLCDGMARVETGEKVKALLEWFVAKETEHLEEIKGIYDFMEAPHYYLEWGEFSNLHPL